MSTTELTARLYGVEVATLGETDRGELTLLDWADEALERWGRRATVLSASLPLGERPTDGVVDSFFDNLLPEIGRDLMASALQLPDRNLATVLAAVGRDCAGAIDVRASDEPITDDAGSTIALTDHDLDARIRALPRRPLGYGPGVRHSLAGVQGKLLATRLDDGSWGLPVGGTPSTHIMKPEPLDLPFGFAANEQFCTSLARRCGLTHVTSQLMNVSGRDVFVTERFDRSVDDSGSIVRIHQEDTCQAFGRRAADKYERRGERRLQEVAGLLSRIGTRSDVNRIVEFTVFNVAIGNTDAHSKNLALLHHANGIDELAPIYDVMNHATRRDAPRDLAMSVNGVLDIDDVTGRDLVDEAVGWGVRLRRAHVEELADTTLAAILAHLDDAASEVFVDQDVIDDAAGRTRRLLMTM